MKSILLRITFSLGLSLACKVAGNAQVIPNPSFEANQFFSPTGLVADNGDISGWAVSDSESVGLSTDSTIAPQLADNGMVPDGSQVAFIQVGGSTNSLRTTITGLLPNLNYRVGFRYNCAAAGAPVILRVMVDGQLLLTTNVAPAAVSQNYDAPYWDAAISFASTGFQSDLTVSASTASDPGTLLVDAFHITQDYPAAFGGADYDNRVFLGNLPLAGAQPDSFSSFSGGVQSTHGVYRELWPGVSDGLATLTNQALNPKWPDQPDPAYTKTYSSFETDTDTGLNFYGQRVRTLIIPPVTGDYTFWISSDDQSELWISSDDPFESMNLIASVPGWTPPRDWSVFASQRSAPVTLQAGQKYALQAIMYQNYGGDNLAVQWQLPDNTVESPIPASRLLLPADLRSELTLVESGFGQTLETFANAPSIAIGGWLTPPGTDLIGIRPLSWEPANGAAWISSTNQLMALSPGILTVVWNSVTNEYLVSSRAVQTPVDIYWSQTLSGGPGGPLVPLNPRYTVKVQYNSLIASTNLYITNNQLVAYGPREGLVPIVYTTVRDRVFAGLDVVNVRNSDPNLSRQLAAMVGSQLSSQQATSRPGPTTYRYGLEGDPATNFLGRLILSDTNYNGYVFVARPTTANNQINVFWTQTNSFGIPWPYEMDSYSVNWPANFAEIARRLYLTEDANGVQTTSPTVDFTGLIPNVYIHYNDEIPLGIDPNTGKSTNLWLSSKLLHARHPGRVLLHYENVTGAKTSGFLGLQLVEVVPNIPDSVIRSVPIGKALAAPANYDINPLPGRATRGTETPSPGPSFAYVHKVEGPMKGLIYPVRPAHADNQAADIEVFWMRQGVGNVAWPYEMDWYGADWPNVGQKFVRAQAPDPRGATVNIPGNLNASLIFQEPQLNATLNSTKDGTIFDAVSAGQVLLRYYTGSPVGSEVYFEYVKTGLRSSESPTTTSWKIGSEILSDYHQVSSADTLNAKPGYIHVAQNSSQLEDRYAENVYTNTGQIFPVNTGSLEVWWMNTNQFGVQWPSLVSRYQTAWPDTNDLAFSATNFIVISSGHGSGRVEPNVNPNLQLYVQNDAGRHGFNPNDEHATLQPYDSGVAVFALRSDLGSASTSLPWVLASYDDPQRVNRKAFRVWPVVAEDPAHPFIYPGVAGQVIQPPFPLSLFTSGCRSAGVGQQGVSGPFWRDINGTFWARAAGDDGGGSSIVMHWYYLPDASFYIPSGQAVTNGCLAWMDQYAGTPGIPLSVTSSISWPTNTPQLQLGETLITAKNGLPTLDAVLGVQVLYQQSIAVSKAPSVELMDPTRARGVPLATLPTDVPNERIGSVTYFSGLPPTLQSRLFYDPLGVSNQLFFRGTNVHTVSGSYLLPNIITARESALLTDPAFAGRDPKFLEALRSLTSLASTPLLVTNEPTVDTLALSAGVGTGTGYVTIARGLHSNDPVTLDVFQVTCPRYAGGIQVLTPSNPFSEKLSLRFDGDLGGRSDRYQFEWRYIPDSSGIQPLKPDEPDAPIWSGFGMTPSDGGGVVDVTVQGTGLQTLSDNWFSCRYRPLAPDACGADWSPWTPPQLQEGWIKRVTKGITPFDQRFGDLGNPARTVNTTVNMIAQAGHRWEGNVPLNPATTDNFGLIEIYETVFKRGLQLSVDGSPPVDYGPANNQLIDAAGKLSDLYMLLGNEAFADASDPTISVDSSAGAEYLAAASSIFAFENEVPNLLTEQLALYRGQDSQKAPGVATPPVYNRLYWNFTGDVGQTAYVLKHDIRDELGNQNGRVDVGDAETLYPQGHGDAWGHYLTATKFFYQLLRNQNFGWVPRSEAVLIGDLPVSVNYVNERKFAQAASAKARTGVEIVDLTYRAFYNENAEYQFQGYPDSVTLPRASSGTLSTTNELRAWGLSDWASRAGQAALFDWVATTALIPPVNTNAVPDPLSQTVDRSTVADLADITASLTAIQTTADSADTGLNPLGLAKDVMPFDIDPSQLSANAGTHFEQIYTRALTAVNNALTAFQYAQNASQQLRQQSDSEVQFNNQVANQTADYNSRLIEIFGTPYADDIGNGGQFTYPSGYQGPDTQHFDYVDPEPLLGLNSSANGAPKSQTFSLNLTDTVVDGSGRLVKTPHTVTYNLSTQGYGLVKPDDWRGIRSASGQLQLDRSDLLQMLYRFKQAVANYDNLLSQIDREAKNLEARYQLNANEVSVLNSGARSQQTLDGKIRDATQQQLLYAGLSVYANTAAGAISGGIPTSEIFGLAGGGDLLAPVRGAILLAGANAASFLQTEADQQQLAVLSDQQSQTQLQSAENITLTTARNDFDAATALSGLQTLVQQEPAQRLELQTLTEALKQIIARYTADLAKGNRLLADFTRFQQQSAALISTSRYKDSAFRIFRNDAVQKYQAQYDLAARYAYLAARAFDFETNFDPTDPESPAGLMTQIVQSRTLGLLQNGQPLLGGVSGDPGLSDALKKLFDNWSVLKGQFGLNNPALEQTDFSLRYELFRIPLTGGTNDGIWQTTLQSYVVTNLYDLPAFKRNARLIGGPYEAGLVIPFSTTVTPGLNFFGRPLGGYDSSFSASSYSTKIRSVGLWLDNYSGTKLSKTPYAFLLPVGDDVIRSPRSDSNAFRTWHLVDQSIPVPYPVGGSSLALIGYIPEVDSLGDSFVDIRKNAPFRVYQDDNFSPSQITYNSRLVGRSVWNTQWLLVIPAQSLGSNEAKALQQLIAGSLKPDGSRDGNGIKDIKLLLQTYSYQGQ